MEISAVSTDKEKTGKTHGLVIINTGNGKGKTTAAMGLMLRAWGHDKKAIMFQFIKNSKASFGEHRAARRMGIEIMAGGDGFALPGVTENIEKSAVMAKELWNLAEEKITGGEYDMVILDEISYPLKFGWLDAGEVIEVLRSRPERVHVGITGRDVPDELIEIADAVTEFHEVKHHFREGVKAQPGIEY